MKYRKFTVKLNCRGEMIPYVHYTESELATWKAVYNGMKEGREKWACSEYLHWFRILEEKNIYSPEFIPQLHDVSRYLKGDLRRKNLCNGYCLQNVFRGWLCD